MDEPSQTSDTLFMTLDPMATISAAAPSGIDFDFISGYTPLSLLGTGGVGVVHLTRQESVRRQVAVKWVRPDGPRPMQARQSLLQEAHAAAALEHPNVVPVYDLIQDAEQGPGVVMRRITGRTWSEYLGSPDAVRDDFGARDTVEWHIGVLEQVCNAPLCSLSGHHSPRPQARQCDDWSLR